MNIARIGLMPCESVLYLFVERVTVYDAATLSLGRISGLLILNQFTISLRLVPSTSLDGSVGQRIFVESGRDRIRGIELPNSVIHLNLFIGFAELVVKLA